MSKTTYILGAGASMSAGAPSVKNFLKKAHDWGVLRNDSNLMGFLNELYSVSQTQDYPNVEEVLTLIDMAIQKGENLLVGADILIDMSILRDDIHSVIRQTLSEAGKDGNNKAYTQFLKKKISTEDTIISLNYDTYLDDEIYKMYNRVNYGIDLEPFDTQAELFITSNEEEEKEPPLLLKLHGSINWFYCYLGEGAYIYRKAEKATKKEIEKLIDEVRWEEKIDKERYSRDPIQLLRCPVHNHPFDSIIIYPTWLKAYDIPQINQIWSQALREISESDELVFIGYSMPSSDTEIRYLLKKALKTKGMKTPTKEEIREMRKGTFSSKDLNFSIRVVNPIEENDFKRKYNIFFKSDVEFIEEYFEDWVA